MKRNHPKTINKFSELAKSSDIEKVKLAIANVRYAINALIFADSISRYASIRLSQRDWLKVFCLLRLIRFGGCSTSSELGRRLLRPKNSMTRLLNDMTAEGLINRNDDDEDRRKIQIKITKKGLSYILKTIQDLDIVDKDMSSVLPHEEHEVLALYNKRLRNGLIDLLLTKPDLPK
jgi:DNA-binding MarR family transcriptional regulator